MQIVPNCSVAVKTQRESQTREHGSLMLSTKVGVNCLTWWNTNERHQPENTISAAKADANGKATIPKISQKRGCILHVMQKTKTVISNSRVSLQNVFQIKSYRTQAWDYERLSKQWIIIHENGSLPAESLCCFGQRLMCRMLIKEFTCFWRRMWSMLFTWNQQSWMLYLLHTFLQPHRGDLSFYPAAPERAGWLSS